jgi:hypothetical protein
MHVADADASYECARADTDGHALQPGSTMAVTDRRLALAILGQPGLG